MTVDRKIINDLDFQGVQKVKNAVDGVDPQDYATVAQLSGGGVSSIAKTGDTQLTGDVTFSEGANITLSEVGNDIEIASTGGTTAMTQAHLSAAVQVGGDITLNHITTFAEVAAATGGPGTGGLDLTIPASIGDVLQVFARCMFNNTTASAESFDVATWVSGAAVNWLGGSGGGAAVGLGSAFSGVGQNLVITATYEVVSGDIDSGNVVLRLMYRSGSATNRVLGRSTTNGALVFTALNLLQ